jgi:hypothetical protein
MYGSRETRLAEVIDGVVGYDPYDPGVTLDLLS